MRLQGSNSTSHWTETKRSRTCILIQERVRKEKSRGGWRGRGRVSKVRVVRVSESESE